MSLESLFGQWRKLHQQKKNYSTMNRFPFFELTGKYLPVDRKATILDIGTGEGIYCEHLKLSDTYPNTFLLDANEATIELLKAKQYQTILYTAPNTLPFDNASVSHVHCSHLVEHLYPKDLYEFIKEIDRVLTPEGILAISTPLLWKGFYQDLSHIKPYEPEVFIRYLCDKTKERTASVISNNYTVKELVYRYNDYNNIDEGLGSKSIGVDFVIQFMKKLLGVFSIKQFKKNGYTLVLKKGQLASNVFHKTEQGENKVSTKTVTN